MKTKMLIAAVLAAAGFVVHADVASGRVALVATDAAAKLSAAKKAVNDDESKVPQYVLEDPLTFANGEKVASAADWPKRREEILGIFAKEMLGQPPPEPEAVETELLEEGPTLAGQAIRRQYRMWFKRDRTGPFVDWLVLIPNTIANRRPKKGADGRIVCETAGKSPVMLMLNYRGNHELLTDPEVLAPEGAWIRTDDGARTVRRGDDIEKARGALRSTEGRYQFPVEMLLARGYAVISACYGQVSPDVEVAAGDPEELAYTGVFSLWPERDPAREDNAGALGAWAWALSRGLDLAERLPEIDAAKSVVTGCSRLGKAALIAAARDVRFAVCVPNQTGGGGAPLNKRAFGENAATENAEFPHWYCKAFAKYANNEQAMKFDQHMLLACVAPRALLVQGYNNSWFDPKGEYLSCRAASPVWEFLGSGGMPGDAMPEPYSMSAVGRSLGYVWRGGRHGSEGVDWMWLLDFADRALASGRTR